MKDVNKKIFIEYVSHLYSTDKSYEIIGKSIKAVKLFLESEYQVNRKGYKAYIRENAVELSDKPYIKAFMQSNREYREPDGQQLGLNFN